MLALAPHLAHFTPTPFFTLNCSSFCFLPFVLSPHVGPTRGPGTPEAQQEALRGEGLALGCAERAAGVMLSLSQAASAPALGEPCCPPARVRAVRTSAANQAGPQAGRETWKRGAPRPCPGPRESASRRELPNTVRRGSRPPEAETGLWAPGGLTPLLPHALLGGLALGPPSLAVRRVKK